MFFIIGYKTCFLMFFILTSMFFTTMVSSYCPDRHTHTHLYQIYHMHVFMIIV